MNRPRRAACRPLTTTEIAATTAALATGPDSTRDVALFSLGCASAFRVSGLLALTVGDAREALRGGVLYLRRAGCKGHHAGHAVPLRDDARPAIERLLARRAIDGATDPEAPLFAGRNGDALSRSQASRVLRAAFAKADLDGAAVPGLLATHSMRKTAAVRIHAAAKDRNLDALETTRRLLGHKYLDSTRAYLPADDFDTLTAVMAA